MLMTVSLGKPGQFRLASGQFRLASSKLSLIFKGYQCYDRGRDKRNGFSTLSLEVASIPRHVEDLSRKFRKGGSVQII